MRAHRHAARKLRREKLARAQLREKLRAATMDAIKNPKMQQECAHANCSDAVLCMYMCFFELLQLRMHACVLRPYACASAPQYTYSSRWTICIYMRSWHGIIMIIRLVMINIYDLALMIELQCHAF